MTDLVSARQAAQMLGEAGLSRSQARRLLGTGLAGEPMRTSSATLYDAARIRELVERPAVDAWPLPGVCGSALLYLRGTSLGPSPASVKLMNVGIGSLVIMRLLISRHGHIPLVATCAGYVTGAAEVVWIDLVVPADGRLALRPAGSWARVFTGRRLYSPPGSHWHLWCPEFALPAA